MRLFLAINLPPQLRRHIWTATEPLREAAPATTWVREPLVHLTLKFFGEQPPAMAESIGAAIARLAALHSRPLVRLTEIGAFPNLRRPSVVWVGVEPDTRLELLHHDVEVSSGALGFELDGRPFRPHLTIGRVKGAKGERRDPALRSLVRLAKQVRIAGEFIVPSIDLMHSTLLPSGPTYATVLSAPLRRD